MFKPLFYRKAFLSALIGGAWTVASAQIAPALKAPADAGTSPFLGVGLTGAAIYQPSTYPTGAIPAYLANILAAARDISQVVRQPQFLGAPVPFTEPKIKADTDLLFNQTVALVSACADLDGPEKTELQKQLDELGRLRDGLRKEGFTVDATNGFQKQAQAVADAAIKLAQDQRTEKSSLLGLKVGAYRDKGSTYQYGTLLFSLPEQFANKGNVNSSCLFMTASDLARVDHTGPVTWRAGIGAMSGDADVALIAISGAYYFARGQFPVLDAETCITGRLTSICSPGSSSQRNLIDHVRPGDIWLLGSVRNLSSPDQSTTGTAAEGGAVLALPTCGKDQPRTNLVTTLFLSGTYCAQHKLGLDEGAAELKLPFRSRVLSKYPIYLSARYGTRDDGTVGLEFRF